MLRTTVIGLIGSVAFAAAPAAAQISVSARADVYLPAPGVFVVFSVPSLPDALVVSTSSYGTVHLEQRLHTGRVNHVRMNLRYPQRHTMHGVVINDYVWVAGRRCLASEAFGDYYEPRHYHRRPVTFASYPYRTHGHAHGHGGHGGYAKPRYVDHRDYRDHGDHHDPGDRWGQRDGRGRSDEAHARNERRKQDKARDKADHKRDKARDKADKARDKADKKRDKARDKADKERGKSGKKNGRGGHGDDNNGGGNGNGRGHKRVHT